MSGKTLSPKARGPKPHSEKEATRERPRHGRVRLHRPQDQATVAMPYLIGHSAGNYALTVNPVPPLPLRYAMTPLMRVATLRMVLHQRRVGCYSDEGRPRGWGPGFAAAAREKTVLPAKSHASLRAKAHHHTSRGVAERAVVSADRANMSLKKECRDA